MICYIEPDIYIRDEIKVALDMSNYATKKNQNMLLVLMHLIQLLKNLISPKAEVDRLNINKLVNFENSLNKFKKKQMTQMLVS